jgi:hypothetical protein
MNFESDHHERLRYVPAGAVDSALVNFMQLPVETSDRRPLGRIAGLVIDLVARRLRYLVIETSRWAGRASWLVPFSTATIDADRRALRLLADPSLDKCAKFDPRGIRELSPEDVVIAVG